MKKNYGQEEVSQVPKYIGMAVIIVVAFLLGLDAGRKQDQNESDLPGNTVVKNTLGSPDNVDMDIFWETWNVLAQNYVDPHELDTNAMVYGAVKGMVESLEDPYTNFMDPKENKEFQDSLQGHLQGIGAELTLRDGVLMVISPLKNSPAQKAGLQPEDIIAMVNDESTQDMSLEEAVMKIRGEKGTSVKLTVIRKNNSEPIEMEIVRDDINVNSINWEIKDGIAIIEINQFGDSTELEFNKAVSAILTQRPEGVILDLRYNGGGYLDGAVNIASEFLDEEKVVTIKKRDPEEDEVIYATGQARMSKLPLVVLINKGSASASEIVAGAIQDHGRGTVVGETSFGKGTVQAVENLTGGSSLRVTIAKWFTPNDQNINELGITPDVQVERTIEDFDADKDPQMDKAMAILKGEEVVTETEGEGGENGLQSTEGASSEGEVGE